MINKYDGVEERNKKRHEAESRRQVVFFFRGRWYSSVIDKANVMVTYTVRYDDGELGAESVQP
jgi:hypothetical protein